MEKLGLVNNRQILYCNVRSQQSWFDQLPSKNWIVFSIADKDDEALLNNATIKCLDKNVSYTCSAGELGSDTEAYFDQEIVWREVQKEEKTGAPQNYDRTPMTTSHRNFSEGFWFATTVAYPTIEDRYIHIETVVCVDCTERGVKEHIQSLIEKINSGWLPSDDEVEPPVYDDQK